MPSQLMKVVCSSLPRANRSSCMRLTRGSCACMPRFNVSQLTPLRGQKLQFCNFWLLSRVSDTARPVTFWASLSPSTATICAKMRKSEARRNLIHKKYIFRGLLIFAQGKPLVLHEAYARLLRNNAAFNVSNWQLSTFGLLAESVIPVTKWSSVSTITVAICEKMRKSGTRRNLNKKYIFRYTVPLRTKKIPSYLTPTCWEEFIEFLPCQPQQGIFTPE